MPAQQDYVDARLASGVGDIGSGMLACAIGPSEVNRTDPGLGVELDQRLVGAAGRSEVAHGPGLAGGGVCGGGAEAGG